MPDTFGHLPGGWRISESLPGSQNKPLFLSIFSLPKPQATPITTKIKKKVEKCTTCLDALEIFGNDLSYKRNLIFSKGF